MFNSYSYHGGNTSQTTNINAVSGAILKNHPKSWFERFGLRSERAERLFTEGGDKGTKQTDKEILGTTYYITEDNPDNAITILQMVICGDMEVIAECVYTKDLISETPVKVPVSDVLPELRINDLIEISNNPEMRYFLNNEFRIFGDIINPDENHEFKKYEITAVWREIDGDFRCIYRR